jgi:hypothetical protein
MEIYFLSFAKVDKLKASVLSGTIGGGDVRP